MRHLRGCEHYRRNVARGTGRIAGLGEREKACRTLEARDNQRSGTHGGCGQGQLKNVGLDNTQALR